MSRINRANAPKFLLLAGAVLALLSATDVGLLSIASDYAQPAMHEVRTKGNETLHFAPYGVPTGAQVHVPAPYALYPDAEHYVDFLVVEGGEGALLLQGATPPHIYYEDRAPLSHSRVEFTRPDRPNDAPTGTSVENQLDFVFILHADQVPAGRKALVEAQFQWDYGDLSFPFDHDFVRFTAAWFPSVDSFVHVLMFGDALAAVAILVLWRGARPADGPASDASAQGTEALVQLASLAQAYARNLRMLTAWSVVLLAVAGVLGFVALSYWMSDFLPPNDFWGNYPIIGIMAAGAILLLTGLVILGRAHREVRRLEALPAPDLSV